MYCGAFSVLLLGETLASPADMSCYLHFRICISLFQAGFDPILVCGEGAAADACGKFVFVGYLRRTSEGSGAAMSCDNHFSLLAQFILLIPIQNVEQMC